MNLTKKGKLTALITVAVMCLAIIITASVIFAPNFYKNGDTDVTNTDISPYGTYDAGTGFGMAKDNMFKWSNMVTTAVVDGGSDRMWICYPKEIYMDTTEKLQDLNYVYKTYAHFGNTYNQNANDSKKYQHVIPQTIMGYYKKADGSQNESYSAAMTAHGNMDEFFNGYTFIGDGSPEIYNGANWKTEPVDNHSWNGTTYCVVSYNGGRAYDVNNDKYYTRTDYKMFSTSGIAGFYTYKRLAGSLVFFTRKDKTDRLQLSDTQAPDRSLLPKELSDNGVQIVGDIEIKINIYNKTPLYNAMKDLENKYTALNTRNLLLEGESNRFTDLKNKVKTLLADRYATQKKVEEYTAEVNSYIFNVCMDRPTSVETNPEIVDYNGNAYGRNNFWANYTGNLSNTNVRIQDCYPSGTLYYSTTGFGVDADDKYNNTKDNLTEAGYYTLTFAPKKVSENPDEDYMSIVVGGYTIKAKFSWSTGNSEKIETDQTTACLYIKPAEIKLSGGGSAVDADYNGDTPVEISGLPKGTTITLVNPANNPNKNSAIVQLSDIDYNHDEPGAWNANGETTWQFPDVTAAPQRLYYRVSASNHFDKFGSFTVKINPADITIKLKSFEQLFNSTLLTSDEIFDQMLDESTPNILDSTSFEKTKGYLKKILTFAIAKNGTTGYYDPSTDHPNVGYYTVEAIRITDTEWARRIDDITFVKDSEGNASNDGAYYIKPRPIQVNWIDNPNKWYDRLGGHRPSATIVDGQETFGQTVTLTAVSVVGDQGTALGGTAGQSASSAVRAGSYTAKVSSTNTNFTISNGSYVFTIQPRKISIEIQPLTIRYAQFKGIEAAKNQYFNSILANNNNNEGYIATVDEEIANSEYATVKDAILHDDYKDVFTVNINASTTPDGKYYVVGTHELELVPGNSNYQITATNGTLTVNPATLRVDDPQVDPKVYNGEAQDIILPISVDDAETGESGTITIYGYEYEHYEDCVTVEYSSVGLDGPWSTNPLTITNVIQSGMTVYCRVSADNHTEHKFSFTQEMSAVNITITIEGQKNPVYYGDPIPNSDKIWTDFGFDYYLNEKSIQEGEIGETAFRKINPSTIFEFYLNDPSTMQAIVNRNVNAGKYTIEYRIMTGTTYDIRNYNLEFEDNKNINAYTISKKLLHIDWAQSGERWTGEGKDHYIFSNSIPTVYPTAPDKLEDGETENVVEGDSITFAGIELPSARYTSTGYEIRTRLVDSKNRNNYTLGTQDEYAYHTFYIDKLEVKIVIEDQTAEYGSIQEYTLDALSDPMSAGSIWNYHSDSFGAFYSDHYSYYRFTSGAQPASGYADVNDYKISILPYSKEGVADGTAVRNNYDVKIVDAEGKTEEEGGIMPKFHITPAKLKYTGRVFNFSIDESDYEDNVITKQMLIERVSTGIEGIEAGDENEFEVKMSDKFRKTAQRAGWVNATTAVSAGDEDNGGEYYIYFQVTHKKGNFEEFSENIELNLHSKWVSIIVAPKVGDDVKAAEYGNSVHTSDELFDSLEIMSITGFLDDDGDQLWKTDPAAAKEKLQEYISLYVIRDRLDSRMEINEKVGDYSIYFEKIKEDENYKNFRFRPRGTDRDASNINVYHVHPRTVDIKWYNDADSHGMDEDYGEHGNSHTGYTVTNAYTDKNNKKDVVRLILTHYVDESVEGNTAKFDEESGHAYAAGWYIAEAIGVTNPNYRIGNTNTTCSFEIRQKVIEIKLLPRNFVYGSIDAHRDNINDALNIYSPQSTNFEVISREPFVGT
ncbi:MAG: hypothetical protein K2I23_06475, partial [Clostridia bacterium]|nr:hypothetical protein [Clostridia bacterium]